MSAVTVFIAEHEYEERLKAARDADTKGIIALSTFFQSKALWNGPFEEAVWKKIKATGKDWMDLTLREFEALVADALLRVDKKKDKKNSCKEERKERS